MLRICDTCSGIKIEILCVIGEFKSLHWFYNSYDVIVSEFIVKSNKSGIVSTVLNERTDTTMHTCKYLDKDHWPNCKSSLKKSVNYKK